MTRVDWLEYVEICGWTLARAHARTGDAALIGGYPENFMAAALAGILGSTNDVQVRCVAAEVIGNAITEPNDFEGKENLERAANLAHFLYGDKTGTIGVIVFQNLQMQSRYDSMPVHRCYTDIDASPLDATKEAIRKNWEYLRDVNLSNTNLVGTWLYGADLAGALFSAARLEGANFRCANLEGADFGGSKTDGADFYLARFGKSSPPSVLEKTLPDNMLFRGSEEQWMKWRKNRFRVRKGSNEPVLSKNDNRADDIGPCFDLRPDRPNITSPK